MTCEAQVVYESQDAAALTGKKVGGYALDQLREMERQYRGYAAMSQPEMDAHQASVRARVLAGVSA